MFGSRHASHGSRAVRTSIHLQPRSSWILAKSKIPSVSNGDSLISDFYSGQLMEFGVRARVEHCESSGLLTDAMSATEMARAKRSILTSSHRDIGPHNSPAPGHRAFRCDAVRLRPRLNQTRCSTVIGLTTNKSQSAKLR